MRASSVQKYIMLVTNNGDDGGGDVGDGDGVDCDMVGGRWVQAGFIRECANCVADRV